MTLVEIKKEIHNKNYTAAIQLMEKLPEQEKTAEFHLLRGICIQLPNQSNLTDVEAEVSLRKAVELEPRNKEAKLELAYFLLNTRRDLSSSKKIFLEVLADMRDEVPDGLSTFIEISQELQATNSNFINSLKLQTETYLSQTGKK